MRDLAPLQGDLQTQVMDALWRIDEGSVERVRDALPPRYRSGYKTVQTVLNRLVERGLLSRERRGRRFTYRPNLTEAEYRSRTMRHALSGASAGARQAALAQFIDGLGSEELSEVRRLAQRAAQAKEEQDR